MLRGQLLECGDDMQKAADVLLLSQVHKEPY
jgi:hypothetical protein